MTAMSLISIKCKVTKYLDLYQNAWSPSWSPMVTFNPEPTSSRAINGKSPFLEHLALVNFGNKPYEARHGTLKFVKNCRFFYPHPPPKQYKYRGFFKLKSDFFRGLPPVPRSRVGQHVNISYITVNKNFKYCITKHLNNTWYRIGARAGTIYHQDTAWDSITESWQQTYCLLPPIA